MSSFFNFEFCHFDLSTLPAEDRFTKSKQLPDQCYQEIRIPLYAALLFPLWGVIALRIWTAWKHYTGRWNFELVSAVLVVLAGLACTLFVL